VSFRDMMDVSRPRFASVPSSAGTRIGKVFVVGLMPSRRLTAEASFATGFSEAGAELLGFADAVLDTDADGVTPPQAISVDTISSGSSGATRPMNSVTLLIHRAASLKNRAALSAQILRFSSSGTLA